MRDSARDLLVSSSSEQRARAAQAWLQTFSPDSEVLILVPHAIAADRLVHELIAESGSRFGLVRFTLNRLAALIAAPELARRGAAPATGLSLAAVVTRAVDRIVLRTALVPLSYLGDVSTVAPLAPYCLRTRRYSRAATMAMPAIQPGIA